MLALPRLFPVYCDWSSCDAFGLNVSYYVNVLERWILMRMFDAGTAEIVDPLTTNACRVERSMMERLRNSVTSRNILAA
jgi:hypothetical protein